MKHVILFLSLMVCFQAFSQRKPKIKGNRNVVEVQKSLPPFRAIELKDDLEISLQQAPEEGYAITADDNLIDVLKFQVEDSTLIIGSFYNITGKKKLDITVYYNYLEAISLRNGDIRMKQPIISDVLDVKIYEAAQIQLNAEATQININMEGNSSGDFTLTGDEMNFVLKDRIDARMYTDSKTNHFKMEKNASARMEGTVDSLNVNLSGNTNLRGQRLEANIVIANLQESATAEVNATTDFELTSSGSSKTYLYGDAKIKIIDFLDTSELHKKKQL